MVTQLLPIKNGAYGLPAVDYAREEASNNFSFSIKKFGKDEVAVFNGKPHRQDEFEIVWVTTGEGICVIDLQQYSIKSEVVFCILPGHLRSFKPGENCAGYILSFNCTSLYLSSGIHANHGFKEMFKDIAGALVVEEPEDKTAIENIIISLHSEFNNFNLLRPEIINGWLMMFLIYLRKVSRPVGPACRQGKNVGLVNSFYSTLEKDFLKKKMVTDYARELSVTPNYLNEIVKRVSGYPASHHIQQRIIIEAKRMAIYSNWSMKEIACLLGFGNLSYFSKFFKTFAGTNFKAFKKKHSL